ncbi:unnamed protein product [Closterium sp. NIES-53]
MRDGNNRILGAGQLTASQVDFRINERKFCRSPQGAGTGGASSRGAGAGGVGIGGAGIGGASFEETGAGGTTTAPPYCHDTCLQAARRREREEQEWLEQERWELQHGIGALGLPSTSPVRSPAPLAFGPTFPPPDASPAFSPPPWSPSPPVVPHYRVRPCPPHARPCSPTDDLRTALLCSSRHRSPPVSFELEFVASVSPSLCAMLLSPEGDPDALDILTPCTYHEAVSGEWASQWEAAMDLELASWRSTGTYDDAVPPPRANVVDGMWLFKVKRSLGSPPVFKACHVARGFNQREGVYFFQSFALTSKMRTLRVFLQGRLHEEIWLRRPPGFTDTFPPKTQWSLRRPDYGLRQSPLYVDDLVFATADRVALAEVKSKLQKRHTCINLGEPQHYLGLQITRDRAARTITLIQSHMVQQVLLRFEF